MSTRFQIAKKDIESFFNSQIQKVYKLVDLREIFASNKDFWRLKQTETVNNFINDLIQTSKLEKIVLDFPNRKETRYIWGKVSIYEVLMELNSKSYFSHYSAMLFNELTEQVPKTIFLNTEQTPKISSFISDMEQKNIDMSFRNKSRETNNIAIFKDIKIYHLSGKFTNNLGVVELDIPDIGEIRTTNIERTLIDITVRPIYSGSIFEVLKAYEKSIDKISVNKLLSYLKQLNYKYPYHQSIGFYLEKAGYKKNQLELVEHLEKEYDFYLDNQIKNPAYDTKWRVYYPKGM